MLTPCTLLHRQHWTLRIGMRPWAELHLIEGPMLISLCSFFTPWAVNGCFIGHVLSPSTVNGCFLTFVRLFSQLTPTLLHTDSAVLGTLAYSMEEGLILLLLLLLSLHLFSYSSPPTPCLFSQCFFQCFQESTVQSKTQYTVNDTTKPWELLR